MGEEKGIASCLPGGGLVKRIDGVVYQIWRQLLAVGGSTILIFSKKRFSTPLVEAEVLVKLGTVYLLGG